jgi:hypothetical protein
MSWRLASTSASGSACGTPHRRARRPPRRRRFPRANGKRRAANPHGLDGIREFTGLPSRLSARAHVNLPIAGYIARR